MMDGVWGVIVGDSDILSEFTQLDWVWGVKVGDGPIDWIVEPTPLGALRLLYSSSSTAQPAPVTFSTLIKHLCKDKLCLKAF